MSNVVQAHTGANINRSLRFACLTKYRVLLTFEHTRLEKERLTGRHSGAESSSLNKTETRMVTGRLAGVNYMALRELCPEDQFRA